jgi:DNA/RNA endonuclease YhcR with UshA esterase domain
MRRFGVRASLMVALIALSSACALRSPRIADIQYDHSRYLDRTVAVEGVVTSSWNVPFVPFALYKVDDGTGELTVVSRESRTPRKGARVRVKGKVEDIAALGDRSIGLHLEERHVDLLRHW